MVDQDLIAGSIKVIAGRTKEALGELVGDWKLQRPARLNRQSASPSRRWRRKDTMARASRSRMRAAVPHRCKARA